MARCGQQQQKKSPQGEPESALRRHPLSSWPPAPWYMVAKGSRLPSKCHTNGQRPGAHWAGERAWSEGLQGVGESRIQFPVSMYPRLPVCMSLTVDPSTISHAAPMVLFCDCKPESWGYPPPPPGRECNKNLQPVPQHQLQLGNIQGPRGAHTQTGASDGAIEVGGAPHKGTSAVSFCSSKCRWAQP